METVQEQIIPVAEIVSMNDEEVIDSFSGQNTTPPATEVFGKGFTKRLEKQSYKIIGRHSAVKPCGWTKKSIKGEGGCYKSQFYGINSHQCVQMTTYLSCANFCNFCWRDMTGKAHSDFVGEPDDPKMILDEAVKGQQELLIGFKGYDKVDRKKYEESNFPKHFAISLTGEPIYYPRLQEMLDYAHSKGATTFLVTSGQAPKQMQAVTPTQLYLSLDAPTKELLEKVDRSINKDSWEQLLGSIDALKEARSRCRTVVRVTCVKGHNMVEPDKYAKLVARANPLFLEVKGYMFVGSSRQRLKLENMPYHDDVKQFALEIGKHCGYELIDESPISRVVLMMRKEDLSKKMLPLS